MHPFTRKQVKCGPQRRGAAAVELALVAPVLFLLVFGIIEFGSLFFVKQTLKTAAREGARQLAIQGATLNEAIQVAQDRLDVAGIDGATITGENAFKGNGDDAQARQVYIEIELPTQNALIAGDYLKLFPSGSTMKVKVTMRKEGELVMAPAS